MKKILEINFDNVLPEEYANFTVRAAVRAVIFDHEQRVALMKVIRDNFHKLPGGGVDEGEDFIQALRRECQEEAGVDLSDPIEIGYVVEIKKEKGMVQNSYCYTASVVGEKQIPHFTDSEKERGFEVVWLPLAEAISAVQNDTVTTPVGRSIQERELLVLRAAQLMK